MDEYTKKHLRAYCAHRSLSMDVDSMVAAVIRFSEENPEEFEALLECGGWPRVIQAMEGCA